MKRRTLDLLFSTGGLLFALVLAVLGLVLQNQADFASAYVAKQLGAQQIYFTPGENLSGEQEAPGGECLVTYGTGDEAARQMLTGAEAECYANQYIAFHMAGSAEEAGLPGATYASLGAVQRQARTDLQAAVDAGQPTEELQARLDEVNALRDTMFRGETLRGLLLTTYGFSIFGERAGQAALLCFAAAIVMLVLSIAGYIHAFRTPKDEVAFRA
jgi:hypothetical protein